MIFKWVCIFYDIGHLTVESMKWTKNINANMYECNQAQSKQCSKQSPPDKRGEDDQFTLTLYTPS